VGPPGLGDARQLLAAGGRRELVDRVLRLPGLEQRTGEGPACVGGDEPVVELACDRDALLGGAQRELDLAGHHRHVAAAQQVPPERLVAAQEPRRLDRLVEQLGGLAYPPVTCRTVTSTGIRKGGSPRPVARATARPRPACVAASS
jgi:hypothetical protein